MSHNIWDLNPFLKGLNRFHHLRHNLIIIYHKNKEGTEGGRCTDEGACVCKNNVVGTRCDKCLLGHYNFPGVLNFIQGHSWQNCNI